MINPRLRIQQNSLGFSLLELMIVLTIIAILAAIAIPNYQQYVKKAKFSEVVTHVVPYKTAVEVCAQLLGGLSNSESNCGTPNQNEIPADFMGIASSKSYVGSIRTSYVAPDVMITASTQNLDAVYTYILKAHYADDGIINWQVDPASTCLQAGLCHQ